MIIWFTEPIEPAFSAITVLSPNGADVTAGDTEFDPTEPTAMWVPLATLEAATYTVVWKNVSSVDGHKATGSFLFAVGESIAAGTQVDVAEQPLIQSPVDPLVRWAIYIGIAIFAGGLLFELLVTTRVARAEDQHESFTFAHQISTRFASIALAATVAVILAQVAQLILHTSIAYDIPLYAANPGQLIEVASASDWGRYWSWRFTVAILACLSPPGRVPPDPRRAPFRQPRRP